MKRLRWMRIALLATFTATGALWAWRVYAVPAGQSGTVEGVPRDQALVYAGGESTNPREYDPATTHGSGDKLAYSGLVSLDPNMRLTPEIAESWDVSNGGTVYTFHLRDNARFHDGRSVTAQDFIYSWERAAAPATGSDTVMTYLGDIVGVKEMHAGSADHISGLQALDDHTLQVTIDAPKPYFLFKLTYPTAFVVDKANVESGQDWYRHPNGTGPYKLVRWDPFKAIVYGRNPDFYLGPPSIPYVVFELYTGTGMQLYETGDVDVTGVPSFDVARVTDPTDPLSADLEPIPYSPEGARQLLAESKYGGPQGLPPIVYTSAGYGSYAGPDVSAQVEMWQKNLGVDVTVQNLEPDHYFDDLHAGKHGQLFSGGWCADYPDPENFADVLFHTGSGQNLGNYSNPQLDALLDQARVEQDVNKRIMMYQQAEQMIVDDAPVLFTTHGLSYVLVKPYVKGYVVTPIAIPLERYLRLQH
jgi:oligopeptide transport system substrate-binding protein